MNAEWMTRAIWGAGAVHLGIIAANVPLPGKLRVRERLAGVPRFVRQIFYVHWLYIVIVLGMFAALCFGFARELAGATAMGRFLSAFMAAFWLLRIACRFSTTIAKSGARTGSWTPCTWWRWWCW
jgi:hypothetical protein